MSRIGINLGRILREIFSGKGEGPKIKPSEKEIRMKTKYPDLIKEAKFKDLPQGNQRFNPKMKKQKYRNRNYRDKDGGEQ